MDPRSREEREVARLVGPRLPADHGLGSLGLLMQLTGSLLAGYMVLIGMFPIFANTHGGFVVVFLVGALGTIRSLFHRAAGGALVYGSPQGIFRPIHVYAAVSAVQTVLTLVLINVDDKLPLVVNVSIGLALLAWPAVLLVLVTRRSMRELVAHDSLPVAEDFGFEGAAALMMLLGLFGAMFTAFMLYGSLKLFGTALGGQGFLVVGILAMLLIRSILHATAGVKGTRGIDSDGATESAARYFSFGVVSSVVTGGALLILFFSTPGVGLHPALLLLGAVTVYLLMAWPVILRRFYSERNFSALLSGADGPSVRRAPDAGMTAVGWLLLGLGVLQLAFALPFALSGSGDLREALVALDPLSTGVGSLAAAAERSSWWTIGVAAVQVWAGYELIRMSDRHRLAATVYGVVASVVALLLSWPQVRAVEMGATGGPLGNFGVTAGYLGIALSLVLPIGTAILANRKLVPTAQARVRSSAE